MTEPLKIVIKLVEDNIADVMAVQDVLRGNTLYDLECFIEASPFLSNLSKDIDLVVTDVRMNNYDAMDTIKSIRKNFPGIRVIVISAAFTPAIYEQLIWYRVDGVVRKDGAYWTDRLMEYIEYLTPDMIERKKLLSL